MSSDWFANYQRQAYPDLFSEEELAQAAGVYGYQLVDPRRQAHEQKLAEIEAYLVLQAQQQEQQAQAARLMDGYEDLMAELGSLGLSEQDQELVFSHALTLPARPDGMPDLARAYSEIDERDISRDEQLRDAEVLEEMNSTLDPDASDEEMIQCGA